VTLHAILYTFPMLPTARLALAVVVLGPAGLAVAGSRHRGEPIAIRTKPTAVSPQNPGVTVIGRLEFRGGLVLRSKQKSFGGFSGLHVSADGEQLTAITDNGDWLTARLIYDERGRLDDVRDAEMGALRDADGKRLDDDKRDAEALAELKDGGFAVAFENPHRIWNYPRGLDAPADPLPKPDRLKDAPDNGGVKSLVTLSDGRLLALTEKYGKHRLYHGWTWKRGRWSPVEYRARHDSNPADATLLPSGDVLVLERSDDDSDGGPVLRLQRLSNIGAGELLEGETLFEIRRPLLIDTFEGVACRAGEDGEPLVYLISDDDFDEDKRTVLLMFALRDKGDSAREP
jgi:hypothetical protein